MPFEFRADFDWLLGHPSVKHSHCEAAIGVMAVKKTTDGVYLFFCHNTDSFVCLDHDLPPPGGPNLYKAVF